jgi:hypothetical protein
MKMYQFNCLDEVRQIEMLWSTGVLVDSRQEGFYKILLYQIDSFYVEVFYQYFQGKLVKLKSFTDTDLLEPYLTCINIASLIGR